MQQLFWFRSFVSCILHSTNLFLVQDGVYIADDNFSTFLKDKVSIMKFNMILLIMKSSMV